MQKIERLTRNSKSEIVDVLIAAFHEYPVMRFVLKDGGSAYDLRLKAIMEFYTEARLAKDRPVLGIREHGILAAVALVDETSLKPWAELRSELRRLKESIGENAYARLELFEKSCAKVEPAEPHYFLGMIGVRPESRGKGYARPILDEVKNMSIADSTSTGVCLSTEDIENVSLYQHFGYRIIAETDIDELHSWCMFLATR